jgi:hypothetical protein
MERTMKILVGLTLVSALAVGSNHDSKQLSWLAGCWVSTDKSAQEVWVVDSDHSLIGFNVVFSDNQVEFYEVLSIRRNEDGSLVYTPHPSGQPSASFVATEVAENSVVFTNPDHDYPQEIKYAREGNHLNATISLLAGAKPNSFDKVACD